MIITSLIEWAVLAEPRRQLDPSEGECLMYTSEQPEVDMARVTRKVQALTTFFMVVGYMELAVWVAIWVNL